jgi:L-ribulose-5-phosphate 4-epimerase
MTMDEGYIKFESRWVPGPAPDNAAVALLESWRRPLFDAGLVGQYEDLGIGYGNISIRYGTGCFVISGTQTGHLRETTAEHYALVTAYDIERNQVSSTGQAEASSESLTHAALYGLDDAIGAVVHVHSKQLWDSMRGKLPTTSPDIGYGTPAMAREFERLFHETEFAKKGVAVMGGHEDGLVSYGKTLEEAARRILSLSAD